MISDKLLALRKKQGLSQQDVADAVGVTRQTVSNWELGQGSPALDKAVELARLYGVTVDDLASDEVEVVSSGKAAARDAHVLRELVGSVVTIELDSDERSMIQHARIPDANEGWVRVEGVKVVGYGWTPEGNSRVVRLIDTADILGFSVEEGRQ